MRAVLCGYYGMGNGGDEALLATLLQMLPAHVEPVVLSGNPAQTERDYQVQACDRNSFSAIVNAFRQSDAFIWGGGSLIQDATSALSPVYYAGLMELAQRMGLKTIAWGQGIGPLHRRTTQWLAQRTFSGCTAISVRDRASAQLVNQWKLPFTLAPDPVWALQGEPMPGLWDMPAPRVAVVLRPHPLLTPERLDRVIQALVDFQTATQTYLLLIPFHLHQDLDIAKSIHGRLPNASHIVQLRSPYQLKGVFQGVEMAIAMRLHGLIMAASAECRCFAISYDPKVTQLMQDFDIPGWLLEDIPEDAIAMGKTWIDHYANGDPLSKNQIQAVQDRAYAHQELLETALLAASSG
ncbi:polysaccharide pyruvyl transferase CsaB [Leptolyngbya sp. AN02str]|uniref:polysaccharide pyruvyl transferase CsaB n=1 Tax=Leptolyngbya sp. AN02str TaxID=3423363 RepID=UPI003D318653